MMVLNQLIQDLTSPLSVDVMVTGLSMDSRTVTAGDLFIATAKDMPQRQLHITQAENAGAVAIVVETEQSAITSSLPVVMINDLDQHISLLADRFYHQPSQAMTVMAVTGTNGKTSVSQFVAQMLEISGEPCGVIGTLGVGRYGQLTESGMTTPSPVEVQHQLADMRDAGIKFVVIEASSHALEQGRLNAVNIDIAAFTNLSRDHLDYHGDMQRYGAAKMKLFDLSGVRSAVLNIDDDFVSESATNLAAKGINTCLVGQHPSAFVSAQNIGMTMTGMQFDFMMKASKKTVSVSLLGEFNIDNILVTAGILSQLGWSAEQIANHLPDLKAVPGRMQLVQQPAFPTVVVDFAHTPSALALALIAMRKHVATTSALWCVFGCGGNRDRGKRALMGAAAEQSADHLVITDDNPRDEASEYIHNEILGGLSHPERAMVKTERRDAIFYAIQTAQHEDMVLIAGKGHENYQEKQGVRTPFSDVEVALDALRQREHNSGVSV
ncbi:UDP-N-acetylmuramoylalanyl-D-glutamate--2,6- diaminopimelate ligase [Methylophaga frappieri]|uniref:UDP-N-acetylmuramoyl-L-alanyl-D-glutamate--2,6-diaminopimelate ligase n=1 Tax=Methylophaga frappieri (strain ATCC BAA-2434 / DSM 25690 / JAM7) TaxID=754477 RepID=I1YGK0_METFJ|nr:UDP-N-acetylmuramoyl-L-alanyl-D-glutamate--2,6-diaminopimelate ligase [Methylophaga frappieri]AFJ02043.1 UDP-N-acetylmuramoylalanyl-D-glutamate--2,6- diaminopimelate ligase [Methylophaga frappieri]